MLLRSLLRSSGSPAFSASRERSISGLVPVIPRNWMSRTISPWYLASVPTPFSGMVLFCVETFCGHARDATSVQRVTSDASWYRDGVIGSLKLRLSNTPANLGTSADEICQVAITQALASTAVELRQPSLAQRRGGCGVPIINKEAFHRAGAVVGFRRAVLPPDSLSAHRRRRTKAVSPRRGVALVGCGATGSALASLLARAGVGYLRIIDRDYVEPSNLQRQVLFDESDAAESLPKAIAAARKIKGFNSEVIVEPHAADLTPQNVEELLSGVDVLLDGTDNFETRYLINDFAVSQGTAVDLCRRSRQLRGYDDRAPRRDGLPGMYLS